MEKHQLATEVIRLIGGKNNVNNVVHCVTRLRFTLKDNAIADTEAIKDLDGVLTVVVSGGQYQVIIGNKVKEVYKEVGNILGDSFLSEERQAQDPVKKNAFNRLIDIIIGIITPIIGTMAAGGIIKGLLGAATALDLMETTNGTYILLNALGDSIFYFLPIIVGFSAGRKFKGNPYIPAAIGGALVYPAIVAAYQAGEALSFFKIPVILASYTSSLFPVIFAAWLAAIIERWLEQRLVPSIKLIFVPLITIFITGTVTFLAVGPLLTEFSQLLASVTMGIYDFAPIIAGILLGGLWQVIVIFGLHYAFIPVLINNITTLGSDPVNAILNVTIFAQAGAALGVFLKTRNQSLKGISGSATVSALLGVTEPAIYGVSLAYKRVFVMAGIAGAIGGGITAVMGAKMFGFGASALFSAPLFINPEGVDSSFYAFIIASLVALIGTAILTYLFGFKDTNIKNKNAKKVQTNKVEDKAIYTSIQGTIIPIGEVKDEVFSSGSMGSGFAIIPEDKNVYAPFDGNVLSVFNTKHAIGLISDDGVELLIHMGIDTVELKGAPFDIKIKENDRIKKGQLIAEVDWEWIKRENYDTTTPIIVTNTQDYESLDLKFDQSINMESGKLVMTIN
ncbi:MULTISPECIES: beta-glucoside-specific PTS transporter subunit IIABC [Niallia]|uniref:beta-glucoside-specific PTS transporter subunit IIABC n=1 Tax=Niallia TaxID=2837506 RepID=UPI001EDC0D9A|nr:MULTISPECIES: beta-glucoside-specific PTS transporter subunit IIABC [Niallia]MED4040092.1 beta-glucoside-specific PTS transporter subunit IIABC [Niallia taxi]UPO91101.1 beta-glucoside-specific PTS transporter subunit IIABC [Niallia sp. Man26]